MSRLPSLKRPVIAMAGLLVLSVVVNSVRITFPAAEPEFKWSTVEPSTPLPTFAALIPETPTPYPRVRTTEYIRRPNGQPAVFKTPDGELYVVKLEYIDGEKLPRPSAWPPIPAAPRS